MSTIGSQMVPIRLTTRSLINPGPTVEQWVQDMVNTGYLQSVTMSFDLGTYTMHIELRDPTDAQWLADSITLVEQSQRSAVRLPPSLSPNYASIRLGGINVAVPVWPDPKVGFDVPMTPEGKLDRTKLPPPHSLTYRRRNVHVRKEPGDLFAEAQDAFSIRKQTRAEGAMDFIIYTYDPTESVLKFRTMTMSGYSTLTAALAEATKQMDNMEQRGVMREAVAWEVLKDAKDLPSSFSATEKRVREIMGAHGKVDSSGMFGVLDFPLMRRMQAMPDKAPIKEARIPFEAHMPAHKKASADDCMAAVRAACANGAHDPNKKFN